MGDQIALLSFYLALVTLLCATFFVRLDTWYGDVLSLNRLVEKQRGDLEAGAVRKDSETNYELVRRRVELEASQPWRGFWLVTVFIGVLTLLSIALAWTVDPAESSINIFLYVYFPGALFEILFFGGSVYYLRNGGKKLGALEAIVKRL